MSYRSVVEFVANSASSSSLTNPICRKHVHTDHIAVDVRVGEKLGEGSAGIVWKVINVPISNTCLIFVVLWFVFFSKLCRVKCTALQSQSNKFNTTQHHRHKSFLKWLKKKKKKNADSTFFSSFNRKHKTKHKQDTMLKIPSHINVVSLIGMCISPVALLVEFAEQGALDAMLYDEDRPRRFNVDEQRSIALGIARGLAFLHHHKIVHRDIAARNIVNVLCICSNANNEFVVGSLRY